MKSLAVSLLLLAQQSGGGILGLLVPMVLIFVVIYFLMIRPQRKQAKEREAMIANIKKNDHVLTTGGIFAVVDRVKEKEVVLKIDEKSDVRVRVSRSAIAGVIKDSGADQKKAEPEESKKK